MRLVPVILSGGVGSRLWPYSRPDFPKPFIKLPGCGESLFDQTISRILHLPNIDRFIVVSNEKYSHLVKQTEAKLGVDSKSLNIWEPEAKNTAAAIAIAAKIANEQIGKDTILLVLPADHSIKLIDKFKDAVFQATKFAESNQLVTFGIKPTRVETGYGYIKYDGNSVISFIEKPDYETAKKLIQEGNIAWNSGMFCFKAEILLAETQKHFPELFETVSTLSSITENNEISFSKQSFTKLPSESIDYAIMEKCEDLAVVPCDIDWDDVGSWTSFEKLCSTKDVNLNTLSGKVVAVDSKNNLILGNDRLIATVGVENLVIVSSEGSTLIAHKGKVQDIKKLAGHPLVVDNLYEITQRPWGRYQVIAQGDGYKVKRIEVFPGGMLSLQVHRYRDEHWTLVQGEAYVTRGDEIIRLRSNEAIFIPYGEKHRLHNRTNEICTFIEVQSGSYLGEDDIIRYNDIYNRC